MSYPVFDIEIAKLRFFPLEQLFQKSKSEIERIPTQNLAPIEYDYRSFGGTEVDDAIEIEALVFLFDKFRKRYDRGDERYDIFRKTAPDILNRVDIGERSEYIDDAEFYILSGKADGIAEFLAVYGYGDDRSGNELHLGLDDSGPFTNPSLDPVKGSVFNFFDDMIDLVHGDGALGIFPYIVHMDDVRESED